ncbi:DsbA family protein [Pseudarcicella hirudinis]|uniref:DsbA family protein n=1 Tax=Pseudarcicella hirudinis TaxID=1079859 RepID=UPI0035E972F8
MNGSEMDFHAFKEEHSSFNISVEESIISRLMEEHEQWAETANVEYTPSIFINGRLLTKPFDLGDVYNFLKYEETPALEEPETVEIT